MTNKAHLLTGSSRTRRIPSRKRRTRSLPKLKRIHQRSRFNEALRLGQISSRRLLGAAPAQTRLKPRTSGLKRPSDVSRQPLTKAVFILFHLDGFHQRLLWNLAIKN